MIELSHGATRETARACSEARAESDRSFGLDVAAPVPHSCAGLLGVPAVGGAPALLPRSVDGGGLGLLVIFSGLGAVMIRFSHATPQKFDPFGARPTIALVRGRGGPFLGGRVAVAALAWLG